MRSQRRPDSPGVCTTAASFPPKGATIEERSSYLGASLASQRRSRMRGSQPKPELPSLLSGWKEIANYLGKGVRTVQRYELQLALPVRRPAGRSRGAVIAMKDDLDAWVSASPMRKAYDVSKAPADPSSEESVAEMRSSIAEMTRLREEMRELRYEVRSSLSILKESIRGLQGEMSQQLLQESIPRFSILEFNSRPRDIVDLLGADMRGRKAS